MKKWEIWCEGYACTGDRGVATLLATVEAETFKEACIKHFGNNEYFREEDLVYWGCGLFDNRKDARKGFG